MTVTPSATQSLSPSTTQSPSQTQTTTQTSSAFRFRAGFQLLRSHSVPNYDVTPPSAASLLGVDSLPIVISDSYPTLYATLWMNRCPEPNLHSIGNMTLTCTVSLTDGRAAGVIVNVLSSTSGFDLAASCSAATMRPGFLNDSDAQQVNIPRVVAVSPLYATASESVTLKCTLAVGSASLRIASASVPLDVLGTRWPLAADAIILSTGRRPTMTSTRFVSTGSSIAMTALSICGAGPTFVDFAYAACALRAARAVWGNLSIPNASTTTPRPFALNITSTSLLILRAVLERSFSPKSTVSIGGVPAVVASTSEDGRWMAIFTPNASTMCGARGVEAGRCGAVRLAVSTPSDADLIGARGVTLECPPFCAGDLDRIEATGAAAGRSVVPFSVDASGSTFHPTYQSSIATGMALAATLDTVAPSPGIQYRPSCTSEGYTDTGSDACTNASDSASFNCAYGKAGACSDCPSKALCPGGERMWPRPGYFCLAETQTADAIVQCADPDPRARCMAWDPSSSAVICGPGYRQGSFLCGACGM